MEVATGMACNRNLFIYPPFITGCAWQFDLLSSHVILTLPEHGHHGLAKVRASHARIHFCHVLIWASE